jgi:peroxiredoxin
MAGKLWAGGVSCLAAMALSASPAVARQITVGQTAPDFKMKLADGSTVTLADLKGQVVIINLWATWCGPCKQEMPALDQMQVNGGKYGLRIFGVLTMDETPLRALRPIGKVLHYPLASGISGGYAPIGNAVPTNYVIDRAGTIRYAKATALTQDEFIALVLPLLNEHPEGAAPGLVKTSGEE